MHAALCQKNLLLLSSAAICFNGNLVGRLRGGLLDDVGLPCFRGVQHRPANFQLSAFKLKTSYSLSGGPSETLACGHSVLCGPVDVSSGTMAKDPLEPLPDKACLVRRS